MIDDVVAPAEREHVATDLAKPAERDQCQLPGSDRIAQKRSIWSPPGAAATARISDARRAARSPGASRFSVVEVAAHASHVGLEGFLERAVVQRGRRVIQRDVHTVLALQPLAVQA